MLTYDELLKEEVLFLRAQIIEVKPHGYPDGCSFVQEQFVRFMKEQLSY
jgi:hypothetical protein